LVTGFTGFHCSNDFGSGFYIGRLYRRTSCVALSSRIICTASLER